MSHKQISSLFYSLHLYNKSRHSCLRTVLQILKTAIKSSFVSGQESQFHRRFYVANHIWQYFSHIQFLWALSWSVLVFHTILKWDFTSTKLRGSVSSLVTDIILLLIQKPEPLWKPHHRADSQRVYGIRVRKTNSGCLLCSGLVI